jgi:hypothetical protein
MFSHHYWKLIVHKHKGSVLDFQLNLVYLYIYPYVITTLFWLQLLWNDFKIRKYEFLNFVIIKMVCYSESLAFSYEF